MGPVIAIQAALAAAAAFLMGAWFLAWRRGGGADRPTVESSLFGFVTNFFDTLGIGSFATTTVYLRARRLISDDLLPGTLNVGLALPTLTQALIFIVLVEVDLTLLVSCVAAAASGAWIGGSIVARLNVRAIRLVMGCALLLFAGLSSASSLELLPPGGEAVALSGAPFALAVAAFAVLGALQTAGIGLYAPALVILSLLGLNPKAVFPIMMSAASFLMPVGSPPFLRSGRLSTRIGLGLTLGGVPGVIVAAYLVRSLPVDVLRWIIVAVVLFTAVSLIRSAVARPANPALQSSPS